MERIDLEKRFDFRKRIFEVHKPDIRDFSVAKKDTQIEITNDYVICVHTASSEAVLKAARDLQDFLFVSMNVSVALKKIDIYNEVLKNSIVVLTNEGDSAKTEATFSIDVSSDRINVYGNDDKGTIQGCYYIEDLMSLERAPFMNLGKKEISPSFSPRIVFSGYGRNELPDTFLRSASHEGMTAVAFGVKDSDLSTTGYMDFNEVAMRAKSYGLDIYVVPNIESRYHPQDADAEEYYDKTYGKLFKNCPLIKGIIMVGEAMEFPSRDSRVSGKKQQSNYSEGIPNDKPSSGWFPCNDYPELVEIIKKSVRKYCKDADVVFWSYNWGNAPYDARIELIEKLPRDISLMVTFEMYETHEKNGVRSSATDYTLSFEGPGHYFTSEAEAAKKCGLRLYTMACSGGLTWDIGVIPYEPCPYQWLSRYNAMLECKEKYGLSGVLEGWTFGFAPSFISFFEKQLFFDRTIDTKVLLEKIAVRDYGKDNKKNIIDVWELWSEAIKHYPCNNADQYGPFRSGPSYPLIFNQQCSFSTFECLVTDYASEWLYMVTKHTEENATVTQQRFCGDINSLSQMLECFEKGNRILESIKISQCSNYFENYSRLINLGRYIACCIKTTIHTKQWHRIKRLVSAEDNSEKLLELLNRMIFIGKEEIENARESIKYVQVDSRLGYEPAAGYIGDEWCIDWKIRQVTQVIEKEIPEFIKKIKLTNNMMEE